MASAAVFVAAHKGAFVLKSDSARRAWRLSGPAFFGHTVHHLAIRFRMIDGQDSIRRHMRIFVNGDHVRRLDVALDGSEEVIILQALSGG